MNTTKAIRSAPSQRGQAPFALQAVGTVGRKETAILSPPPPPSLALSLILALCLPRLL
ncbi:MAG: hypothetical protein ABFS37_09920 [Acidobacteriota bacterium]